MPKPICCSSLVLDVLDSHKLVLDRGGHHPALVCATPRAAQTCAFWIWIQIQHPNSKFLYFLLVRVTRVKPSDNYLNPRDVSPSSSLPSRGTLSLERGHSLSGSTIQTLLPIIATVPPVGRAHVLMPPMGMIRGRTHRPATASHDCLVQGQRVRPDSSDTC